MRSSVAPKSSVSWVQAMLWLVMAIVVGVITFILWMVSTPSPMQPEEVAIKSANDMQMSIDYSRITHVDELNELRKEVNPISFDTLVRDLRHYPAEFKDINYFKNHKGEWTVQVMDVAEHDVITDYLDGRKDRKKFAYFRYRDDNDNIRYILTYDVMPSPQMAMGAAKTIDFKLPDNVRVLPEEIERYLAIIENYELSEPVQNFSVHRPRKVELKPTEQEVPPREIIEPEVLEEEDTKAVQAEDLEEQKKPQSIKNSTDAEQTLNVDVQHKADMKASTADKPDTVPVPVSKTPNQGSENATKTPTENNADNKPVVNSPSISNPPRNEVAQPREARLPSNKPAPAEATPENVVPVSPLPAVNTTSENLVDTQ